MVTQEGLSPLAAIDLLGLDEPLSSDKSGRVHPETSPGLSCLLLQAGGPLSGFVLFRVISSKVSPISQAKLISSSQSQCLILIPIMSGSLGDVHLSIVHLTQ